MPTVVEINTMRKKAGLPLIRYNLRKYSEQDVADLRLAFAALYEISDMAPGDHRGYWAVARGHGYDQELCHTDPSLFLTWHRSYVYWFEKALNAAYQGKVEDPDAEITLPYWNWTIFDPETDAENGLPMVVNAATYTDPEGEETRNPLAAARSLYRIEALGLEGDEQYTVRYPTQLRDGIPILAEEVEGYYDETDYSRFNDDFDGGAHGAVHVWVGGRNRDSKLPNFFGDMGQVVSAAYDPIFWLHHCMVDRVFFRWQKMHGDSTVSDHVRASTVYGGFTGAEVLDSEGFLKIEYGDAPVAAYGGDATVQQGSEEAPLPPTLTLPVAGLADGVENARLHLQGMRPPRKSYEVRVFVGEESADASTTTRGNPRFGGRLFFFGHGECFGAPGHCNPDQAARGIFDRRPGHPLAPRNYSLDITSAVQQYKGSAEDEVRLSFVVLDGNGDQVAPEELDFDSITLVAR